MKIVVIGSGHVGLVVAACLANQGNKVTVIDIDEDRVKEVNRRVSPFDEEGLSEILRKVDIEATTDYQGIANSDVTFIYVVTPAKEDGSISLEYVVGAANQIASVLKKRLPHDRS